MFIILSIFHFYRSTKSIRHLKNMCGVKSINGIEIGADKFVDQFNKYVDEINSENKKINIITGIGYLLAALTALFSYSISSQQPITNIKHADIQINPASEILTNNENSIYGIYKYSTTAFHDSTFDVATIAPENINSIVFYYKNENNQSFSNINNLKQQEEALIFATNAGIFSKSHKPLGLYVENGKTISSLNTNTGEGNFYLQPNGVFLINETGAKIIETKNYQDSLDAKFATQSGPMLVINNEINSLFNKNSPNKYVRSGVGLDENGNIFFVISNQPVTFYEFASFFKEKLNCNNALYLDGAISEMYVPDHRENTKEEFSVMIGILKK